MTFIHHHGQRVSAQIPVLMKTLQVVLKWVNSTPCQGPKYESIAFEFGMVITFQSTPNPDDFVVDQHTGRVPG